MSKALLKSQYTTSTLSLSAELVIIQGKQADTETVWARAVHRVTNSTLKTEGIKQHKGIHKITTQTPSKDLNENCYILMNIWLLKLVLRAEGDHLRQNFLVRLASKI